MRKNKKIKFEENTPVKQRIIKEWKYSQITMKELAIKYNMPLEYVAFVLAKKIRHIKRPPTNEESLHSLRIGIPNAISE